MGSGTSQSTWKGWRLPAINQLFQVLWLLVSGEGFYFGRNLSLCLLSLQFMVHNQEKNTSSNMQQLLLCCLVVSLNSDPFLSPGSKKPATCRLVCERSSGGIFFVESPYLAATHTEAEMPHAWTRGNIYIYTFKVLTFNPFVNTKWQDLCRGDCHRYQDFTGQPNSSMEDRRCGPCDLLANAGNPMEKTL